MPPGQQFLKVTLFLTVVIYCVYTVYMHTQCLWLGSEWRVFCGFLPASNSELLVENRIGSWKAVFLLQCLASRTLFIKILTLGEYTLNRSEGYLPKQKTCGLTASVLNSIKQPVGATNNGLLSVTVPEIMGCAAARELGDRQRTCPKQYLCRGPGQSSAFLRSPSA